MSVRANIAFVLLSWFLAAPSIASSCIDAIQIQETDGRYEASLVEHDYAFLSDLLADNFVWVHNDASAIDSKGSLLDGIRTSRSGPASTSRVSTDVEVRQKGSVAVVTGFTTVRRTGSVRPEKYHFMRTYVLISDRCLLLANHTMRLPDGN